MWGLTQSLSFKAVYGDQTRGLAIVSSIKLKPLIIKSLIKRYLTEKLEAAVFQAPRTPYPFITP